MRREPMSTLYFHHTPNPAKGELMLEETGLAYQLIGLDMYKGAVNSISAP